MVSFPFSSSDGPFPDSRENAPGSPCLPSSGTSVSQYPSVPSISSSLSEFSDTKFCTLIDSSSSDCFVDTLLVNNYGLQTLSVPLLQLRLFDGTTNSTVTQAIDLPVCFASGEITLTTFYITLLDGSCAIILGHSWLACHNPLIDWVTSSITFWMSTQTSPVPLSSASTAAVTTLPIGNLTSNLQSIPAQAPDIDFLSPSAFTRAAHLDGSVTFSLDNLSWVHKLHAATTSDPIDLSAVPPSYHEFADVVGGILVWYPTRL